MRLGPFFDFEYDGDKEEIDYSGTETELSELSKSYRVMYPSSGTPEELGRTICPYCGRANKVDDDNLFCEGCGNQLVGE